MTFDGGDLLVHLEEGDRVSRLNLIGPDGELYRGVPVAAGETTVRIPLLEISPGNYEHYTPGEHQLVAVTGETSESLPIDLQPELRVIDVKQHSGSHNRDLGNLEVTVENVGTGPTWVYAIGYTNLPNVRAAELGGNPGNPKLYLKSPQTIAGSIVPPGGDRVFIGALPPFVFTDEEVCSGEILSTSVIIRNVVQDVEHPIEVEFSGGSLDVNPGSIGPQYVCGNLETN